MIKFEAVPGYEDSFVEPTRATSDSAGYDFYMPENLTLLPGEWAMIPTRIRVYIELGTNTFLSLHIRSSMSIKGLELLNKVGIIDADYYSNPKNNGEIIAIIKNNGTAPVILEKGERFIQGIFMKYYTVEDDNPRSENREGGLGSTGK